MMPEYDHEDLTINLTQVFSVYNWTLKPNQPERPPFTNHIKVICNIDVPVDYQAPKTSSQTEKAQQAAGGPTSLGATGEEGSHPQLSSGCDASTDSITKAGPRKSAPNDSIPSQQVRSSSRTMDTPTKNYSVDHIFTGTNQGVLVDKTEPAVDGLKTAHTDLGTSIPHPPSSKSTQIQELIAQVYLLQSQKDKLEQEMAKAKAKVAELKNIEWELQVRFATVVENASGATGKSVPSAGKASASPAEGEKNTYLATKEANLKNNLVDLMGIDPFSLLVDLNINSPTYSQTKACSVLVAEGKLQLQFFGFLEDRDHLHFSLCGGIETEDKTLTRASVQLG
nr:hypothetical protein [Tanacetum cinerariifolium]